MTRVPLRSHHVKQRPPQPIHSRETISRASERVAAQALHSNHRRQHIRAMSEVPRNQPTLSDSTVHNLTNQPSGTRINQFAIHINSCTKRASCMGPQACSAASGPWTAPRLRPRPFYPAPLRYRIYFVCVRGGSGPDRDDHKVV